MALGAGNIDALAIGADRTLYASAGGRLFVSSDGGLDASTAVCSSGPSAPADGAGTHTRGIPPSRSTRRDTRGIPWPSARAERACKRASRKVPRKGGGPTREEGPARPEQQAGDHVGGVVDSQVYA